MEATPVPIPARSRREAMDWGLVMASQEIETEIFQDEQGCGLLVAPHDYDRALQSIRTYQKENRGWKWHQRLPGSDLVFHKGSLIWAAGMIFFYWWSNNFSGLKAQGVMDSAGVASGKWWLLFTAITLHADMNHLLANITTGTLLLGLAMARYGGGVAVLAAFMAGALGNIAGAIFHPAPSHGLGASGMVMGALGLLAVQPFSFWRKYPPASKILLRSAAAAVLILVLFGFSPGTDIIAHVGGFVGGALAGSMLAFVRPSRLRETFASLASGFILAVLVIASWWNAAR